jgi:hypothetical protein
MTDNQSVEMELTVDELMKAIKGLTAQELFKVNKVVMAEIEKRAKSLKEKPSRKTGKVPTQFQKPQAWVSFVEEYARTNGWEEFIFSQKKKDGSVIETAIPGGEANEDGEFVIEGTISEKTPKGKKLTGTLPKTLSKIWWSPKEKTGSHPEIYEAFEEQYVPPVETETASESPSETTTSTKRTVEKKTLAEREAEKEAKKAQKEAEKEAKKEAKEAEKAEKAAQKEAQKEAMTALRDAIKSKSAEDLEAAIAAAEDSGIKSDNATLEKAKSMIDAVKAVPKTASTVKIVKTKPAAAPAPAPAAAKPAPAATKTVVKPVAPKPKEEAWVAPPDDGTVLPWTFKGQKYFRNAQDAVWRATDDGDVGDWVGLYDPAANKIDDTVEEPQFDDE